ncbi:MAG: Fido protein, partial [Bacilli bacterium]|nr:Fido protein [Bacilli bacterium]
SIVELLPLPVSILDELRTQSRERTVILSTRIEGNTLDEAAARKALYADSKGEE